MRFGKRHGRRGRRGVVVLFYRRHGRQMALAVALQLRLFLVYAKGPGERIVIRDVPKVKKHLPRRLEADDQCEEYGEETAKHF